MRVQPQERKPSTRPAKKPPEGTRTPSGGFPDSPEGRAALQGTPLHAFFSSSLAAMAWLAVMATIM